MSYTDLGGKHFAGCCPWCYEAITLRVEISAEGLEVEYVRHEGLVCKAYQWHSIRDMSIAQDSLYRKLEMGV